MMVPNYLYESLQDFTSVLLSEINKLDEETYNKIKSNSEYIKAYNSYLDALGKYYGVKKIKLEDKSLW